MVGATFCFCYTPFHSHNLRPPCTAVFFTIENLSSILRRKNNVIFAITPCLLQAFSVVHYALLLICTFAVSRPQTFFSTPRMSCAYVFICRGRGEIAGAVSSSGGHHSHGAGATLRLPRLAGGWVSSKLPRLKLSRMSGPGFH